MEYRIKEEFNKFYPQVKIIKNRSFFTRTYLFLKNIGKRSLSTPKTKEWVHMNVSTNKRSLIRNRYVVFSTLRESKLYILSLDKGVVYHKWYEKKKIKKS